MEFRSRISMRETSPDRAKVCLRPKVKAINKVKVFYYLSRNGQLEHPHYMELTHFADQPLRLKDVMERLSILRGKGMASLYSWSCKRSYKNGYVWNDLGENDILYPAEGSSEYVLKGSERFQDCSAKLQQLEISNHVNKQQQQTLISFQSKETKSPKYETRDKDYQYYEEEDQEEELEYEILDDEKKSTISHTTTSSTTPPRSRFSKEYHQNDDVSPPKRVVNRGSALLQLIACASSVKNSYERTNMVGKNNVLHKGVLCKSAYMAAAAEGSDEEMIKYMSENPRFGNVQSEAKEYFSGSIVESAAKGLDVPPPLKKSNSYNEERSGKAGLEENVNEEKKREKSKVKGKCIPLKRSCASSKQQSKK